MSHNKLTKKQLQALKNLNTRLKILQDRLIAEVLNLDRELKLRVADENDILDDYEIELQLSFFLKEDDNKYKKDDDNILTSLSEYLKGISIDIKQYPWRWDNNHNEFRGRTEHLMKQDYHCWWFHCLYDHTDLEFKDMLRIGRIWSDIKVYYQYFDEE
jgi:hypothetical protein